MCQEHLFKTYLLCIHYSKLTNYKNIPRVPNKVSLKYTFLLYHKLLQNGKYDTNYMQILI